MKRPNHHPLPVHLVAGGLGVGKTTAILDHLRRNAARGAEAEFIAVLVNDFGPVGLDQAILEADGGGGGAKVIMIPGGCICCTAAAGVHGALRELAAMRGGGGVEGAGCADGAGGAGGADGARRLDRVIIEPSGLTLLGSMTDLLRELAGEFGLALRPTITILDPKVFSRPAFLKTPYFVRMIEGTDILVANRADLATAEQLEMFRAWAAALYPPKLRVVVTDHGRLPEEAFALEWPGPSTGSGRCAGAGLRALGPQLEGADLLRGPAVFAAGKHRPEPAHVAGQFTDGLCWGDGAAVPQSRVEGALKLLAAQGHAGAEVARLKALLHTTGGWLLLEIACGEVFVRETDYRRDNRVDWITTGGRISADAMRRILINEPQMNTNERK